MMYYINLDGQTIGPMTQDQMMAYAVKPDTMVSKNGEAWAPLYTYPELMHALQNSPAMIMSQSDLNSKKILCGVLAIVVGSLGIQYFVLGKVAGGLITILLSIVTCGLWSILTFVQGILMLCMSDAEFKRKYVDSTSTLPLF